MTTTLEALEQRVAALEARFDALQSANGSAAPRPTSNIPLFAAADAQQPAVSKAAEEAFKKMGIPVDPPMSFEEFKKLRDALPMLPEEEWASREIMRMREE